MVPIDFEYNHSQDKQMNIVSVAYMVNGVKYNLWLHDNIENKTYFKEHMLKTQKKHVFLAHNVVAESRAFLSLGLKPQDFKWIDNFIEHRMITNHNDKMMYGKQLLKGSVVYTTRKEWGDPDSIKHSKPEHSLAATTFKMLGKSIDLNNKDDTRDIIIRADYDEVEANRERILAYGASDIENLVLIHKAHIGEYKRLLGEAWNSNQFIKEQKLRGDAMARTAVMTQVGYPINFKAVRNFAAHTDDILGEIAKSCNEQFPEVMPFSYDIGLNRYKVNTANIKKWIEQSKYKDSWAKTKTGYSLARDEWDTRFSDGHIFKVGNFGSQMLRYFYTKQHMNGFQSTKGKKRTFWDSVGSDGRVRPWLNPYRAQSSRFQPLATGFIPLKAAWMRSLIQPKAGRAIAAIDYSSEEFLISALWSGDKKMLAAYISGDVYLAFAKAADMVPQEATKKTHVQERQIAKAIVLGISYGKTMHGLADDLECSKTEAQEYIDLFNTTYSVFHKKCTDLIGVKAHQDDEYNWIEAVEGSYQTDKYIKLECGWIMWGDNSNMRSVGNCPIQGLGASILRKAIQLCQDAGLEVMYPLHDALYIEYAIGDEHLLHKFKQCMIDAFTFYFPEDQKEDAANIRVDFEVWGYEDERTITIDGETIQTEYIHIDERHTDQYHQFKKYFEDDTELGDL